MINNNLSVFHLEWMQQDWLPSHAQRRIVAVMPIIFSGLVFALLGGLVFGLLGGLVRLVTGLLFGLVYGLLHGLLELLPSEELDRIVPAEALGWSWREFRFFWYYPYPIAGLGLGLGLGLVGLVAGFNTWLVAGLLAGLLFGLVTGLLAGLTTDQIVTRAIPNEGIRRSLRNSLISFPIFGLVFGLVAGLVFGLVAGLLAGLSVGLVAGLLAGLVFAWNNGGLACFKHYVLRILLWRNDYAPWNYVRFLDYAAERVFLRKVGGGYIFTHRLLMEYFATLQPTDQTRQT